VAKPAPARGRPPRPVALAAMVLSVLAITIFVVILLMGMGGATEIGRIFGPLGIAATGLGLIAAIWATLDRETRAAGVVSLVILVPCVFLALISAVALISAG
jgi:ABC-type transport system involved in cytochrome c biogenesis permease component